MENIKKKNFLISPSLLSSDFSRLKEEVVALEEAGADWIHFDVMDGHFVSNLTFGAKVLEALRPLTNLPLDVHLMIENPESYYNDFISAGANYLTLHFETLKVRKELRNHEIDEKVFEGLRDRVYQEGQKEFSFSNEQEREDILEKGWIFEAIRKRGCFPGITLKPKTNVSKIRPFLPLVDLVLVMTVEPGFGGQTFMRDQISKIDFLDQYRRDFKRSLLIEVDGGIKPDTAKLCKKANILVAGNYIFSFLNKEKQKSISQNLSVEAYSKAIQNLKSLKN